MADKNADLAALQKQLSSLMDDLSRQQEEAQTIDAVKAIDREIVEVNHRLTIAGQLVFKASTEKITSAVGAVREAQQDVDDAIGQINKLNRFITTISKFLGLVDKAIDAAKLLA